MDKYSEDSWVWKKLINLTLIGNLIVKKYLKCLVIIICYLNPCTVKDIKVWVVTDSLHAAHLCGFKDSFYNLNIKNGHKYAYNNIQYLHRNNCAIIEGQF